MPTIDLAELRRDLLQPRREIDRRPDAGEIEPVAAADVAVQHLADVEREAEADRVLAVAARLVERVDQCLAPRARAASARRQTSAASSPFPASGKIASRPSPMNFSTSPPCSRIGGTWQSK